MSLQDDDDDDGDEKLFNASMVCFGGDAVRCEVQCDEVCWCKWTLAFGKR